MYNKGVLSPLTSLVGQVRSDALCSISYIVRHEAHVPLCLRYSTQQISATLDRIFSAAPVDVKKDHAEITKRKLVFDLAENVITILWCLRSVFIRSYKHLSN